MRSYKRRKLPAPRIGPKSDLSNHPYGNYMNSIDSDLVES
ncbi:hypothetical protein LEP1GSC061_1355 [Leptospira wolffii serovar Khorat str. Khorat-H2]|nr:hypothetical protein LEP1GSC061_1355 [Leptospira wolffii serovar Khorat str. Khorat-H2]